LPPYVTFRSQDGVEFLAAESFGIVMIVSRFLPTPRPQPKLAIECRWLRRTIDSGHVTDPFRMLCTHIVRDGKDCVGPFLEDMETECQLWEPNERLAARIKQLAADQL
jgi:hypothetical protein